MPVVAVSLRTRPPCLLGYRAHVDTKGLGNGGDRRVLRSPVAEHHGGDGRRVDIGLLGQSPHRRPRGLGVRVDETGLTHPRGPRFGCFSTHVYGPSSRDTPTV